MNKRILSVMTAAFLMVFSSLALGAERDPAADMSPNPPQGIAYEEVARMAMDYCVHHSATEVAMHCDFSKTWSMLKSDKNTLQHKNDMITEQWFQVEVTNQYLYKSECRSRDLAVAFTTTDGQHYKIENGPATAFSPSTSCP